VSLEERASPSDAPRSRSKSSSLSAERLASQLLDAEDREYLEAIQGTGAMSELDGEELLRVASEVEASDEDSRRVDLLDVYYVAGGNDETSKRRRLADRFFLQRVGEPATAASLVERLAELTPELKGVKLERIGGADGPLVLRAGDHVAAVLDDYEEETDTDQYNASEAEARKRGVPMVTVRGLVRAINVLLDRHNVRERLMALRGDDEREIYVAMGVAEAVLLAKAGHLEDDDTEDIMDLGAW
jgi:hypothetical protein